MKGFSVDSASKQGNHTPPKPPAEFTPVTPVSKAFAHLATTRNHKERK